MIQFYVLVFSCLLTWKILLQNKLFFGSIKFCWVKSIIKFSRFASGITCSCVRGPNFGWTCVYGNKSFSATNIRRNCDSEKNSFICAYKSVQQSSNFVQQSCKENIFSWYSEYLKNDFWIFLWTSKTKEMFTREILRKKAKGFHFRTKSNSEPFRYKSEKGYKRWNII